MKRVLALSLFLGTSVLAGGREPAPPAPVRPITAYSSLSGLRGTAFDRAFMGWLASYLKVTQEMANSTFYGGKNAEVKVFAQQVKAARTAELATLKSWGGGQAAIIDILGPRNTYEEWFLTYLPSQNEQVRQLLNLVPGHTRNAGLRQFSAELLHTLNAEDIRSRELLKDLK